MPAAEGRAARPDPEGPLTDAEIDRLFSFVGVPQRLAIAVSGGADSLALMVAADRWCGQKAERSVVVLTVDHRLRKGSRGEAATVVRLARERGLEARMLVRKGPAPTGDIEAAAREARYRLLIEACRKVGATCLAVAHHRDDVAETFLLRLRRGAGVFGLAAMRSWLSLGDLHLVRPFLSVPRARLAATTAAANLEPAIDPMNADARYDRVRIRRLLPLLAGEGLDPAMLAAAADRLADAAGAIDDSATRLLLEGIETDAMGIAWLDRNAFAFGPRAVVMRALGRLVMAIGGEHYPPRHRRLWALLVAMDQYYPERPVKRTLAGTVMEGWPDRFPFYREAGRNGLPTIRITPGFTGIWDHRFAVTAGKGVPAGLTLGPLGVEGRKAIGVAPDDYPAAALAALPALRLRGRIVAVPPLGWASREVPVAVTSILAERLSRPPLFPDLAGGG